MRWEVLIKAVWVVVFALIALLTGCTLVEYQGSAWIYLLFTALSTALLFFGFGRGAIFFDAFIGVLLWIGFWLKFSVRTALSEGRFNISVGNFDGGAASLDKALLVVCCAFAAILLGRLVRQRWGFSYPLSMPKIGYAGIFAFYRRFRGTLLCTFVVAVVLVCAANAWFGFYQRGQVARVILPLGLNGVFSWLLMFGMASVSALILRFEFELNRERYWVAISLAMLEAALSNISLWSRGMILNGSSLLYGAVAQFKRSEMRLRLGLASIALVAFVGFFVVSVVSVNWLRANAFYSGYSQAEVGQAVVEQTSILFLDRWVGIEGVMSVVGSNKTGWDTFAQALGERFDTSANSFYDRNFVESAYDNTRDGDLHFVSLPGFIAFLFYPGSYLFLFCAVLAFSMLAAGIEYLVYRLGGQNLVFCALIAQVVAFRYTSFGYVPMQSYLLFGSILLNVLILYFSDRLLRFFYRP
ncbi:hypothetical protein SAMN05216214_110107 [Atopomonas hussainii]|uniref:Oligosaccharide repeat unit polymerase n=1 Tax=Atopomonas hussainii TaxID=1429083 RepID=A0A1H7P4E6_9GAMM|nr:hypothetical protein [Atopomonas hussainii]SEL30198.1 hypothetical protein SAMN05216214_110107 [Atopomonas hussainii]